MYCSLQPLSAADYLELCRHFHTIFVQDIPKMTIRMRPEARRFITFIDTLYEYKVCGQPMHLVPWLPGAMHLVLCLPGAMHLVCWLPGAMNQVVAWSHAPGGCLLKLGTSQD